jgi:hypothetical protein
MLTCLKLINDRFENWMPIWKFEKKGHRTEEYKLLLNGGGH